jgi:phosphatidylglycerol:prolipoprotein diacylglycerol transferase
MISAPNRIAFIIDGWPIFWYGLIVASALVICYLLLTKLIKNNQQLLDQYQRLFGVLVLSGFVGARLFEVIFYNPTFFLIHPWQIINPRLGGLSIFGGIIGVVAILLLLRSQIKGRWWLVADLTAILATLGQAIGRWGNFFNQELYGLPCQNWWCLKIAPEYRLPGWESFASFHPTFFYESILLFLLFIFLWQNRQKIGQGFLAAYYLIGYGLIRFLVEFIRIDVSANYFGLKWPQLVSALFVLIGLSLFLWLLQIRKSKA